MQDLGGWAATDMREPGRMDQDACPSAACTLLAARDMELWPWSCALPNWSPLHSFPRCSINCPSAVHAL